MVYAWCFFRQQVSEIKRRAKKKKKFKKKKKKGRKTELPNIGRFVKAAIYTIGALRYMCSSLWISTRMSRRLRNWSRLQVKLLESFKRTQFLTYFWSMHRYYIIRGSKMRKKEKKSQLSMGMKLPKIMRGKPETSLFNVHIQQQWIILPLMGLKSLQTFIFSDPLKSLYATLESVLK